MLCAPSKNSPATPWLARQSHRQRRSSKAQWLGRQQLLRAARRPAGRVCMAAGSRGPGRGGLGRGLCLRKRSPLFFGKHFYDQNNPKRQAAGPLRGSPKLGLFANAASASALPLAVGRPSVGQGGVPALACRWAASESESLAGAALNPRTAQGPAHWQGSLAVPSASLRCSLRGFRQRRSAARRPELLFRRRGPWPRHVAAAAASPHSPGRICLLAPPPAHTCTCSL